MSEESQTDKDHAIERLCNDAVDFLRWLKEFIKEEVRKNG